MRALYLSILLLFSIPPAFSQCPTHTEFMTAVGNWNTQEQVDDLVLIVNNLPGWTLFIDTTHISIQNETDLGSIVEDETLSFSVRHWGNACVTTDITGSISSGNGILTLGNEIIEPDYIDVPCTFEPNTPGEFQFSFVLDDGTGNPILESTLNLYVITLYLLTVNLADGTTGSPTSNEYFAENEQVPYGFSPDHCHDNLTTSLNGNPVSNTGNVLMDQDNMLSTTNDMIQHTVTVNTTTGGSVGFDEAGIDAFMAQLVTNFNSLLSNRGIIGDYINMIYGEGTDSFTYLGVTFHRDNGGVDGVAIDGDQPLYDKAKDIAGEERPGEDPDGDGADNNLEKALGTDTFLSDWGRQHCSSNKTKCVRATIQTTIDCGGSITITAIPDTGYLFIGWTGDFASSDNPLVLNNVVDDVDLMANLELSDNQMEIFRDNFNDLLISRGIIGDYINMTYDDITDSFTYLGVTFHRDNGGFGGVPIDSDQALYDKAADLAADERPVENPDGDAIDNNTERQISYDPFLHDT